VSSLAYPKAADLQSAERAGAHFRLGVMYGSQTRLAGFTVLRLLTTANTTMCAPYFLRLVSWHHGRLSRTYTGALSDYGARAVDGRVGVEPTNTCVTGRPRNRLGYDPVVGAGTDPAAPAV
jgi:hypothetical protein